MGFNSLTSPLTFANAQATYNGYKAPSSSPAPKVTSQTAAAPTGNMTTWGTGVGGSTPTTPQAASVGTYAAAAAAAQAKAAAQAQADFNAAKGITYSSINENIGDTGNKLNTSVLDYLGSLKSGQRSIDRASVQNELSRESGRLGVLDMVGTGIRSGGVMLNNKGATNSSAAEAIAKAYGALGRKQLSSVGNQYETGLQNIQDQQTELGEQTATFQRHYGEQKQSAVNSIVQDASSKLAALNAAAQNASLVERINIESEKARIRNDALSQLSGYDATLNNGVSSVTAATTDTNRASAKAALLAGTAPESAFQYTAAAPAQFQGTGPYASPLQVFSNQRKQDDSLLPVGA